MTTEFHAPDGHTYSVDCDMIEATCLRRPDESWTFTDAAGHEHYWTFDGRRGTYRPDAKAETPTLETVHDGTGYWEDGEPYEIYHHECRICRETVEPRCCADQSRQYVPGPRYYYIDGECVSQPDFMRAVEPFMKP